MKNKTKITGTLTVINKLPSSNYGNPRYHVAITDKSNSGFSFRTAPDAMLGYSITNYDGKSVEAVVGMHYGFNTIESIKEIKQ